jgi:hypothetical protein
LKGENQLPKVVQGVKFQNGIEVTEMMPKSDQTQRRNEMTRCARNGLMREVSVLGAPDGLEAT